MQTQNREDDYHFYDTSKQIQAHSYVSVQTSPSFGQPAGVYPLHNISGIPNSRS